MTRELDDSASFLLAVLFLDHVGHQLKHEHSRKKPLSRAAEKGGSVDGVRMIEKIVTGKENEQGGDGLEELVALHRERCVHCGLCVRECAFLQRYGTPGAIAAGRLRREPEIAFACSLCGLCGAVCPPKIGLRPERLFLAMRRQAVRSGRVQPGRYRALLFYERMGLSRWLSLAVLPQGCDTVFFPGCALPGSRPELVTALAGHLRRSIARLGIVLDCCTKPSHDLGRQDRFSAMFQALRTGLLQRGVRRVLVACPSCLRVFREYGRGLEVSTVYEALEEALPPTPCPAAEVTVHDACSARYESGVREAVRRIAAARSLTVREMEHHGERTICCGEGGAAGCRSPELAHRWGRKRREEAGGGPVVTYCAGCTGLLAPLVPTVHLLDLLFSPEAALAGRTRLHRPPRTYLNRLLLKGKLARMFGRTAACRLR